MLNCPKTPAQYELWERLFNFLDADHSGFIDFKEFIGSISVGTRGTPEEKLRFAFHIYDKDGNGFIEKQEMLSLLQGIFRMIGKVEIEHSLPLDQNSAEKRCDMIFKIMDKDSNGKLSMDEFLEGCRKDRSIMRALSIF